MKRVIASVFSLVIFPVLVVGCAADPSDSKKTISNDVSGSLREWSVEVDADGAREGTVNFTIKNDGTIGHEFLVVKTDIAVGQIPLVGDRFEEPSDGIEVIDEIGEYPAGETKTLSLSLDSGNYQLVCNLPGHYAAGMHTAFEVTE